MFSFIHWPKVRSSVGIEKIEFRAKSPSRKELKQARETNSCNEWVFQSFSFFHLAFLRLCVKFLFLKSYSVFWLALLIGASVYISLVAHSTQPVAADTLAAGLRGQYFDNDDFTNLKLTRTDATVDFNWGFAAPDPLINSESFSIRWTGQLTAPTTGNYVFVTQSDDGVSLWLGNQLLIDNFTPHPNTEDRSAPIALIAGQSYNLRLEYFEISANAVIRLMWIRPGQTSPEVIPSANLTTPVNPNAAPTLTTLSPSAIPSGNSAVNLTINGSGFLQGAIVQFNNSARTTSFTSGAQLTAVIPASDIAFASLAKITVVNPLPGGGTSNPLMLTITGGFESDVSPRPTGNNNGQVTIADWTQLGRFASGLDLAANGGEFQRVDCAPKTSLGDGRITLADWVQAGRYATVLDPVVAAGGPAVPVNSGFSAQPDGFDQFDSDDPSANLLDQMMFGLSRSRWFDHFKSSQSRRIYFTSQSENSVSVVCAGQGNENAIGFSLQFDSGQWQFVSADSGDDAGNAALFINSKQLSSGRIGLTLALPPNQRLAAGNRRIAVLTFRPRFGNIKPSFSPTAIEFADHPVARELVDVFARNLPASFAKKDQPPVLARLESAKTSRR